MHKQHDDRVLHLYGSPIPVVEESIFLGILFDRKLSFIPHIKYLKAKCLKALNLLKVLSHTSWGADRTTLLKLFINPSLVLVQPRKTRPYITERLLMGRKESNQTKKTSQVVSVS